MSRRAEVLRTTKETDIRVALELDGSGKSEINTGIGFFDHMLEAFSRHGLFDLTVQVTGDLRVDDHHTIEDTGLALGQAIREAAGDKAGIQRFGSRILPMDDALVLCALDLGGRPWFSLDGGFRAEKCGEMGTQMVAEFFYSVAVQAAMNLHMKILDGQNDHHKIEALFKAFGRSLDEAVRIDPRIDGVMSTKGTI